MSMEYCMRNQRKSASPKLPSQNNEVKEDILKQIKVISFYSATMWSSSSMSLTYPDVFFLHSNYIV